MKAIMQSPGIREVIVLAGVIAALVLVGAGYSMGVFNEVRIARANATPIPTVPAFVEVPVETPAPLPTISAADAPPRIVEATLWSSALGREMPYLVSLPRGYDSTEARYPVLYMLHGYGGGHGEWQYYGLFTVANRLIDEGVIPPMIIVTPEGELGYWMDHANNGPRFGTYVVDDIVPAIDAKYRTRAARTARAIGGLSMGADGAVDLATHHPELFSVVGVHSPVLRTKSDAHPFFGNQQYYDAHAPLSLVANSGAAFRDARFALWMDAGSADPWLPHTLELRAALQAAAIPHEWHQYEGSHGGAYWQEHLADYLRFYGNAFTATR